MSSDSGVLARNPEKRSELRYSEVEVKVKGEVKARKLEVETTIWYVNGSSSKFR